MEHWVPKEAYWRTRADREKVQEQEEQAGADGHVIGEGSLGDRAPGEQVHDQGAGGGAAAICTG